MPVVIPSAMASIIAVLLPAGTGSILIVAAALCFGVAKSKNNDNAQQQQYKYKVPFHKLPPLFLIKFLQLNKHDLLL
jgi:hypothetical protein